MKIIKIGVTGGMGCGKSGLIKHLKNTFPLSIYTLDLDSIAFKNYNLNKWTL